MRFQITNLRMPKSTRTSGSFTVTSLDHDGYLIDQATNLLAITMATGAEITSMAATSSSNLVSEATEIKVAFRTPTPLKTGDQVFVTLPPEVTPPSKNNLTCLGDGSALTLIQACTINA